MKKSMFLTMAAIAFLGVSVSLFYSCKRDKGATDPDTEWVGPDGTVKLDNAVMTTMYKDAADGSSIQVDIYYDPVTGAVLSILFNGETPAYVPQCTRIMHDKQQAYSECAALMEQYPCVKMLHNVQSSSASFIDNNGEPVHDYVIFYDDYDENGDCWFENL